MTTAHYLDQNAGFAAGWYSFFDDHADKMLSVPFGGPFATEQEAKDCVPDEAAVFAKELFGGLMAVDPNEGAEQIAKAASIGAAVKKVADAEGTAEPVIPMTLAELMEKLSGPKEDEMHDAMCYCGSCGDAIDASSKTLDLLLDANPCLLWTAQTIVYQYMLLDMLMAQINVRDGVDPKEEGGVMKEVYAEAASKMMANKDFTHKIIEWSHKRLNKNHA